MSYLMKIHRGHHNISADFQLASNLAGGSIKGLENKH